MPSTCGKYESSISRIGINTATISCSKCNNVYHKSCVNFDSEISKASKWKCSNCVDASLANILEKFNKLKEEVSAVKHSVSNIKDKIDDVIEIGQASNKSEIQRLKNQNIKLKWPVDRLEALSRERNIVITGIPQSQNENLFNIINNVESGDTYLFLTN